jgi:hypothetical protein
MATERFAQWLKQTRDDADAATTEMLMARAAVFALLTIAIAINDSAEMLAAKGRK